MVLSNSQSGKKIDEKRCKHCNSRILVGSDDFCCGGCEVAWDIVHNFGLESFYTRKGEQITSKVDENVFIVEELFEDQIVEVGENLAVNFYITSVRCAACVWLVESLVSKLDGVASIRVNYATYHTKVEFDPKVTTLKTILEHIARIGNPPVPDNPLYRSDEKRDIFMRFGVGAFFTMQLMLYTIALYAGYFQDMPDSISFVMKIISLALTTPVVLYTGAPFFKNTLITLRNKHLSMDVLVTLGAGSAYIYSIVAIFLGHEVYFETTAMIFTLITLGRYLEISAKDKARSGMLSLFSLSPPFARLLSDDGTSHYAIPVSQVKVGDVLQVLPGDKISVDGVIIEGFANIDESMLTGEPIPVGKGGGVDVYAGTISTDGQFVMNAVAVGKDTVLSQIIRAIEAADMDKTKILSVVDRISSIFVPFVLIVALLTFVVHYFVLSNGISSLMVAIAVLVVACPCALGLSVPLAVNMALNKSLDFGVIIKNGDLFESLLKSSKIFFDKTGTITQGSPNIEKFYSTMPIDDFLYLSTSVENMSNHVLAKAICSNYILNPSDGAQYGAKFGEVYDFVEYVGEGISGRVGSDKVVVGRHSFVIKHVNDDEHLYSQMISESIGRSVVSVGINGKFVGYYIIHDPLRDDAIAAISQLKKSKELSILSGDNYESVRYVAEKLDVTFYADLLPMDKVEIIKIAQERGDVVIMVGDGINDAPALAQADGSIAMGNTATDVAANTADALIIRAELSIIQELYNISKLTSRVVKQNLFWAFSYNIVVIPLACVGLIHPIISAICMSVSSLLVVLNSLRIKSLI